MSEYILDVKSQTSKVDWAFPFQRTGPFPIDRSSVFSSLSDAEKYANGLDDERKLGGTSYIGQIVSVYEAGETPMVSAYIIGPTRTLLKLAATTATGDISQDIIRLEGLISGKASTEYVNKKLDEKANANAVYTKSEVESYVAQQIANIDHLKRVIVNELPDISQASSSTIYMIKKSGGGIASWGKNIYEEYMAIDNEWELLGNSQVDLTGYEKTEDVNKKLGDKANKATTLEGYGITDAYTKGETYSRGEITELIGQITGGESAADVLAKHNEYKGRNDERVGKVEGRVETLEKAGYQANVIEGIKLADAANALTLNNKIATIPAAGVSQYGLVKLSSEIGANNSGALEIKSLDSSKLAQKEEDWLILDGGTSGIE